MARPLRIEFAGAVYHITARGNERKQIFKDEDDYKQFIEIVACGKERHNVIIYCYALMTNHYHLLIETRASNLSRFMHDIQTRYTMYFNRRHRRVGHLFQGRYNALILDKNNYLLELSRYIHLNPVRAGMVKRPEEYQWSSYGEYIKKGNGLVFSNYVLEQFGSDDNKAIERYKKYTKEGRGIIRDDLKRSIYGQLIIGTKEFTDKIKRKINKLKISPEIPERSKISKRKSIDGILEEVSRYYTLSKEEMLTGKSRLNDARKVAIYLVRKHTDAGLKFIAELFGGVHYSAISQAVKRVECRRSDNKDLDRVIKLIESKL